MKWVDITLSSAARIAIAIILSGCAHHPYTWTPPAGYVGTGQFRADQSWCLAEANQPYIPWVAGDGPRWTLYKDCMEKKGYAKQDRRD